MLCTIWYDLYNLENVKNTHGGVLLVVKLQAVLKVTLLHGCFSRFSNCANGTKLHKASHNKASHRYKNCNELPHSILRLKKTFSITHKPLVLVIIYVLPTNCFTVELPYMPT